MDTSKTRPTSDAEWYCRKDPEEERFYEIFFQLCRKYSAETWEELSALADEVITDWSAAAAALNGLY